MIMAKREKSSAEMVDRMRNLLAFLLVGTFIACIPLFAYKTIPEANNDIIVYMVGQLSGMALTALGLYFTRQAGQEVLDEQRTSNTGKMAEAVKAAAQAGSGNGGQEAAAEAAEQVATAAVEEAEGIKEQG
jgi:hypothetical protein